MPAGRFARALVSWTGSPHLRVRSRPANCASATYSRPAQYARSLRSWSTALLGGPPWDAGGGSGGVGRGGSWAGGGGGAVGVAGWSGALGAPQLWIHCRKLPSRSLTGSLPDAPEALAPPTP